MTNGSTPDDDDEAPSRQIDARIEDLGGWRGETLARLRALIKEADPDVVDGPAFKALIREAVARGEAKGRRGK